MLLAELWQGALPVLVATWRHAQHNHITLTPTYDEVVNLTVFCGKQRIKRIEWKEVKVCRKKHKEVKDYRLYVKDKDQDP